MPDQGNQQMKKQCDQIITLSKVCQRSVRVIAHSILLHELGANRCSIKCVRLYLDRPLLLVGKRGWLHHLLRSIHREHKFKEYYCSVASPMLASPHTPTLFQQSGNCPGPNKGKQTKNNNMWPNWVIWHLPCHQRCGWRDKRHTKPRRKGQPIKGAQISIPSHWSRQLQTTKQNIE